MAAAPLLPPLRFLVPRNLRLLARLRHTTTGYAVNLFYCALVSRSAGSNLAELTECTQRENERACTIVGVRSLSSCSLPLTYAFGPHEHVQVVSSYWYREEGLCQE